VSTTLIGIILGLMVVFGSVLLLVGVDRERVATARRLKSLSAPPTTKAVGDKPDNVKGDPWIQYVPTPFRAKLDEMLSATGYSIQLRVLVIMAASGFVLGLLAEVFLRLGIIMFIVLLVAMTLAPSWFLLKNLQARHTARFLDQFPDAIDLIVRAVRAGLPVIGALDATGRETPDPVGMEFRLITADLRIGIEFDEALRRADLRIRLTDFSFFVASLILQRESGGNLSETLSILSAVLRRRRELRMKVAAMTSEAKTSAMVIAALPFVASGALAVMNPNYVGTFFVDSKGPWIIGAAAAMLGMGWISMKSLISNAVR
jgi:tight adherence protein B